VYVTYAVTQQVARVGTHQKQIALQDVTGGSRRNPVVVALRADGRLYRLMVADTHAAWRNHQTAETIADFDSLYDRLSCNPGQRLPVKELTPEL
jgi:hypothetical protein